LTPRGPLESRGLLDRPAPEVATDLLGCVIEHETAEGLVAVTLTEVEAYAGTADPASHAYRGLTARNAVMFGPPGHAYVYFTYGMHFCVNLVCMPAGTASAVLLRAGQVIAGEDLAHLRRASSHRASSHRPSSARDLARGPARLCQALGIDRSLDGTDVCDPASPLRLRVMSAAPADIADGPRVGVREGADVPWRFWVRGEPTVSAYRPHVLPAPRPALPRISAPLVRPHCAELGLALDWACPGLGLCLAGAGTAILPRAGTGDGPDPDED
jgi:DNA-3-methyladenine glycosylase